MTRKTHLQERPLSSSPLTPTKSCLGPRPFAPQVEEHQPPSAESLERAARFGHSFGDIDLFPRPVIQPKLRLGPVGDRYEQEAEPVQEKSISEPTGTTQAKEEAPPNRTGMPDHLKSSIENLSGIDLSGVRVHRSSSKPARLNALAYTQGREIHLARGQERHLPHEAWHVVQQAQGRVKPTMQLKDGLSINDEEGLEFEADVMGAKALQMHCCCKDTSPTLGTKTVASTQQTAEMGKTSEIACQFSGRHSGAVESCIQLLTDDETTILNKRFKMWQDEFERNGLLKAWWSGSPLRVLNDASRMDSFKDAQEYMDNHLRDWLKRLLGVTGATVAASSMAASTMAEYRPTAYVGRISPETSEEEMSEAGEGEGSGLFRESLSEKQKQKYLEQLSQQAPMAPLGGPRISIAPNQFEPEDAVHSMQVAGHNNDCVLAAFRTVKPKINDSSLVDKMTSTEEGIKRVAYTYSMNRIDQEQLRMLLTSGKRAFITAGALYGQGYHAYAALGLDQKTGKVIAWDTDFTQRDIKLVPFELIHLIYA